MSKPSNSYSVFFVWTGPLVILPPVVGYVVGRLVGESSTPVVATVLPLVFGLLSVLTFQVARNRSVKDEALADLLGSSVFANQKDEVKKEVEYRLRKEDGIANGSAFFPVLWTLGVVLFCLTFMWGKYDGVRIRVPHYPEFNFETANLSSVEFTDLHRMRMHLQSIHLSADEFNQIMKNIIQPIIFSKVSKEPKDRAEELNTAIRRLIGQYEPTPVKANSQSQSLDVRFGWIPPLPAQIAAPPPNHNRIDLPTVTPKAVDGLETQTPKTFSEKL